MMIITILQMIGVMGTILAGLVCIFWPAAVQRFTGLQAQGGRGLTEIRAFFGAFLVGLGAAVFLLNHPAAYATLGFAYLATAAVRLVSIFIDRSAETSNLLSLAAELIFGVILIL
jgi:hypothetical protein